METDPDSDGLRRENAELRALVARLRERVFELEARLGESAGAADPPPAVGGAEHARARPREIDGPERPPSNAGEPGAGPAVPVARLIHGRLTAAGLLAFLAAVLAASLLAPVVIVVLGAVLDSRNPGP